MRIAVIADIHGNLRALEAVLAEIRTLGVDLTIDLGDCLSGPLQARETADLLMSLALPTVRGNHDRFLVEQPLEQMGPSDRVANDQLSDPHRAWLRTLPASRVIEGAVFMCHGTPKTDDIFWLERVTETGAVAVERPRTIEAAAVDVQYPVLLCGHSHIPRQVRLADGRLIVNPGSVGLPGALGDQPVRHAIENGSPDARFAVLSRRHGQWQAAHHAVAYDHRPAARRAAERGRADWASALASGWIDTA